MVSATLATAQPNPSYKSATAKPSRQQSVMGCRAKPTTSATERKTKMSVSEFVAASFARFEREYGPSELVEISSAPALAMTMASNGLKSEKGLNSKVSSRLGGVNAEHDCVSDKSWKYNTIINSNPLSDGEHDVIKCSDEEDSFWALLTTLYIPLIFIGVRRSAFGTVNFLRSLLFGHILRLVLSLLLLSVPPGITAKVGKWWSFATQLPFVQHILWALTGDNRYYPHNYHHHHLQHYLHHGVTFRGGGSPLSSGSLAPVAGVSVSGQRKGLNPDHVWPPPALTLLTLITVLAFIVHPDGLTWIMLGKFADGMVYFFKFCALCWGVTKGGSVPSLAASAVLISLVLLGGLIHRTLYSKQTGESDPDLGIDASGVPRSKSKRGKKGRSGRHGQNYHRSRSRGRVRGGHYRSAKDLYNSPTRRQRSLSPSLSRSPNCKKKNKQIPKSPDNDTFLAQGTQACIETHNLVKVKSVGSTTMKTPSPPQDSAAKSHSHSIDSSVPQFSDDVSSCSSIAGSFSDVKGSKTTKGTSEDADNALTVTESAGNRRRKRGRKRGKNLAPSAAAVKKNVPVASSPCSITQTAFVPVPPGFVAKDLMMLPSSLQSCSASTLPTRAAAPFPAQKSVRHPTHTSDGLPEHVIGLDNNDLQPSDLSSAKGLHSTGHFGRPILLTQTNNGGVVQGPHSKPPLSSAPVGFRPSSSLSATPPSGIVRYSFPNYSAYAHTDGRYAPGKIELAAFLAQVGLVGSACAQILEDLFDVDALAALTPQQFYSYKIGNEKQLEIAALLEARRLRIQHDSQLTAPTLVRPPPGLNLKPGGFHFVNSGGLGLGSVANSKSTTTITKSLSPNNIFSSDCPSTFFLPPPSIRGNCLNLTLPSINTVGSPYRNTAESAVSPLDSASMHPFSIGSRAFHLAREEPELDDECRRIDADLQRLGDRMVGSILDF